MYRSHIFHLCPEAFSDETTQEANNSNSNAVVLFASDSTRPPLKLPLHLQFNVMVVSISNFNRGSSPVVFTAHTTRKGAFYQMEKQSWGLRYYSQCDSKRQKGTHLKFQHIWESKKTFFNVRIKEKPNIMSEQVIIHECEYHILGYPSTTPYKPDILPDNYTTTSSPETSISVQFEPWLRM